MSTYLTLNLMCIFLVTKEVGHLFLFSLLFVWLFERPLPSPVKCPFLRFAHVCGGFLLTHRNSSHILDNNPSPSFASLFIFNDNFLILFLKLTHNKIDWGSVQLCD